MSVRVERLRHVKVDLALHALREGAGRPLLLLHGLGERTPAAVPPELASWPGPVGVGLVTCPPPAAGAPVGSPLPSSAGAPTCTAPVFVVDDGAPRPDSSMGLLVPCTVCPAGWFCGAGWLA